jgi:hypothetical protein
MTPRHEHQNSCLHAHEPGPPAPSLPTPESAVRPAPLQPQAGAPSGHRAMTAPAYTSQRVATIGRRHEPALGMAARPQSPASVMSVAGDIPSPPGSAGLPVDRRARPGPLQRCDSWTARPPVRAGRQAHLAACRCPRGSRQHPMPARQHDAMRAPAPGPSGSKRPGAVPPKPGAASPRRESLAADPRVVVHLEGGDGVVIVRRVVEDLGASPRFRLWYRLSRQIHRKFHWLDVAQTADHPAVIRPPELADLWSTRRICQRARIRKYSAGRMWIVLPALLPRLDRVWA